MLYKAISILSLIVATAIGGCHSNPTRRVPFEVPMVAWNDDGQYLPKRVGPGLVAAVDEPIPDVSMPIGFKPVISHSSRSWSSGWDRTSATLIARGPSLS